MTEREKISGLINKYAKVEHRKLMSRWLRHGSERDVAEYLIARVNRLISEGGWVTKTSVTPDLNLLLAFVEECKKTDVSKVQSE